MLYEPCGNTNLNYYPRCSYHRYKPYATSATQSKPMNSDSDSDVVLSHCNVAIQTDTVDGKCSISVWTVWDQLIGSKDALLIQQVQIQLQATIDKLEDELEISAREISKYRVLWKNECRVGDADRYGGGVSQTSWSSPSPYRDYCEPYNLYNFWNEGRLTRNIARGASQSEFCDTEY